MVRQTKSNARSRPSRPRPVAPDGTNRVGGGVASPASRPMMLFGSMSEHAAHEAASAVAAAKRAARAAKDPGGRSMLLRGLRVRRGAGDGAQPRAREVALQDGEARDELRIGLADLHRHVAQLLHEGTHFGTAHALRFDGGEEAAGP